MDKKELWKNVISCLQLELSKPVIATFFDGCELASVEGERATILCPSKISTDYLKSRYSELLTQTLSTLTGSSCTVTIRTKTPMSPMAAPERTAELGPIFKVQENDGLVGNYTFENYVVGLQNQLAVSVAQTASSNPGQLNPLFIHSGVGLGKTHLLHAIGNQAKENRKAKVLYSSSEQFTNEFIRSIQNGRSAAAFRKRFRSVDMLLIDDIQFIAGREGTQEEFFNTFNELNLAGKQIVLASDRHPSEIQKLEERLVSRFNGGMVADIQEPDMDMRMEILRRKSAEKGAAISDDVLFALADQISGSIRQLEGVLNQILAIATTQKINPTREMAQMVTRHTATVQKLTTPSDVVKTVGGFFGVEPEEIASPKREQKFLLPRQVAAYLLRSLGQLSLKQIGEVLGGRDHTTILHSIEKIEKELSTNELLQRQVKTLRVEILGKTK